MPKKAKHHPVGKKNDPRAIFTTDVSKVPQSLTFVRTNSPERRLLGAGTTDVAKDLTKHPSCVKFNTQMRESMRKISENFDSATSKLLKA